MNRPNIFPTPPPAAPPASQSSRPVVASYLATFLKPEMLHIYRQLTALDAFRPVVFARKREQAREFPFSDLVLINKPWTHQLRRLWQRQILRRPITLYRSEVRQLLSEMRRAEARLLHIYFGHLGVHLLPLIERCPYPVVVSFHGADAHVDQEKPAHLAYTRQLLCKATLLLVRSESLGERLLALGADRAKIRVHRTGIPLAQMPFQQRIAPEDGAWRCVQACRLIPKKGLPASLKAFAEFAGIYPRATFTIAGEGPCEDQLRSLASGLGIRKRVFFAGFLSQEQLRALHSEAHMFLHPSEEGPDGDREGVPNAMLEAMASGLPVVATSHGGIPEAVENGKSGLLVPEQSPAELAQAMLTLAGDPERYRAMSLAAVQRIRQEFDLARQARLLEAIYSEALQSSAGLQPL